jgi:hypothetical protein
MTDAYHLASELAVGIFKVHSDVLPAVLKDRERLLEAAGSFQR